MRVTKGQSRLVTNVRMGLSIIVGLSFFTRKVVALSHENFTVSIHDYDVPSEFAAPFDTYPNPLGITPSMRRVFHPVVKMFNPQVIDLTQTTGASQLILPQDQDEFERKHGKRSISRRKSFLGLLSFRSNNYAIGKYDENRAHLYSSEMFQNEENNIDGFDGARTIHIGVDLGGPVGTKVFSFWNGIIHSSGYNPELGDYAHVVVVEYDLEDIRRKTHSNVDDGDNEDGSGRSDFKKSHQNKFWCLYGHLDKKTIMEHKRWKAGDKVKRGEMIGRMGDVRENGGWQAPHVHFQLSLAPPASHDMPGAVSLLQRSEGLIQYPDPRLVLGEIY